MAGKVATALRIGGVIFLAVIAFLFAITQSNSPYPSLLILASTIALAVYHAYDGGSLATTTAIPLLVAAGLLAGVFVNEMGGCPPVPGCRTTSTGGYLGLFWTAGLLGVGAYAAGSLLNRELAGNG